MHAVSLTEGKETMAQTCPACHKPLSIPYYPGRVLSCSRCRSNLSIDENGQVVAWTTPRPVHAAAPHGAAATGISATADGAQAPEGAARPQLSWSAKAYGGVWVAEGDCPHCGNAVKLCAQWSAAAAYCPCCRKPVQVVRPSEHDPAYPAPPPVAPPQHQSHHWGCLSGIVIAYLVWGAVVGLGTLVTAVVGPVGLGVVGGGIVLYFVVRAIIRNEPYDPDNDPVNRMRGP